VSGDGQRFLISRALKGGAAQPLNVCLNWLRLPLRGPLGR
jgi:hypothetical protein